jgi:ABC-type Zn2+ transport system substrate-binding protein/surface adhesin
MNEYKHVTPGGQGPWFVALLFNTSRDCKKQTHLVAHTHPHMAMDILNKSHTVQQVKRNEEEEEDNDNEEEEDNEEERDRGKRAKKRLRKNDSFWTIMMKVGPFEDWAICVEYLHLWSDKIRGPMRRLERGLEIYSKYRHDLRISLWAEEEDRKGVIQRCKQNLEQLYHPDNAQNKSVLMDIHARLQQNKKKKSQGASQLRVCDLQSSIAQLKESQLQVLKK